MMHTHIGFTSLVVAGFAWVIGCALWDARRGGQAPARWRSTVAISVAVWVVVWALPLVDVAVNWTGNLGAILRYFVEGDHPSVGLGSGVGIMADEFRWVPNWLGAPTRVVPFVAYARSASALWLLVPVALVTLGLLAARRTGSRTDARMVGFAAVLLVVGTVAISSADEPRAYTFQWRAVVAAFIVVTCVWSIAAAIEWRVPRVMRAVALVAVLAVIGWGTLDMGISVASSDEYWGLEARGPVLGKVMRQLRASGLPEDEVVLVDHVGSDLPSLFDGVVNELAREGVDVRVQPELGRVFGEQRTATPQEADVVWKVTDEAPFVPRLLAQPDARIVADTSPLTPAELTEAVELRAQLGDQLRRAGRRDLRRLLDSSLVSFAVADVPGVDMAAAKRLAALNVEVDRGGGCPCGVVVATPGGRTSDGGRGTRG
jgi:hypothetical protein